MPPVEKEKFSLTIQEMAEQKYTLKERLKPLPEEDWYKGIYQDCLRNPLGADCLAYLLKRNGKSTEIPHWDTGEPTGITIEEYAGLLRKAPTMMTPDHYVKKNQEVENVVKTKFYAVVPKDLTENYQAYWEDYVYFDIAERAANGILDRTYYWFLFEGLFRGNNFRDSFVVKKYLEESKELDKLKLLTEDDWYRGIYLEDSELHFNPLLADCFANWLKENGESTEIPDMNTGESTNVTVEEIAALLRKAPTPMLPDVYVKTINHEVEDVVLAKFYEIVPEDLFQNYFKFFLDWMNPSIPRLRNGKNFEPWRAILDEETKFDIYTD